MALALVMVGRWGSRFRSSPGDQAFTALVVDQANG